MTVTDHEGIQWTAKLHGSTYLLTRPGAMRWVSKAELEQGSQPIKRLQGPA
jgi:hypothetical protein